MLKTMKRKNYMRFIASIIVATLLITSFNFQYILASQVKETVTRVKELTELRTENTTVYLNSDGTKTAYIYDKPIRYKDKDGKLDDIDNSIEDITSTTEKSKYKYKNKSNKFDVLFPESMNPDEPIKIVYGKYNIGFKPKKLTELDLFPAEKVKDINNTEKTVKLKYKDVFQKGIELNYTVMDEGVKEDIVLSKVPASNIFEFELSLSGLVPEKRDDNNILLKNKETGEVIGAIPRPYMFDSSKEENLSEEIGVSITEGENAGSYLLTYVIDESFLKAESTIYPVTIDPQIKLSSSTETGDAYVESISTYAGNNYDYSDHLRVGYDDTTGKVRSFVKHTLPTIKGIITSAYYHAYEFTGNTSSAYIGIYRVKGDWSASTITWSNQPTISTSYESGAQKTVNASGWYYWDISKLVSDWYGGTQSKYGFCLKESTDSLWRKFYSSNYSDSTKRAYLEINYSDVPNPTVAAGKITNVAGELANNSSTGYFDLSWPSITGATGYKLAIYNGASYQYFDVGNTTSYTTHGKGIWPTVKEISAGRYLLHDKDNQEGEGGEFPDDPVNTYIKSGGSYKTNHNFWFRLIAYNKYGQSSALDSNVVTPTLPDTTPPENVPDVKLTFGKTDVNTGDSFVATISWATPKDYPTGIASGIKEYRVILYEVLSDGTLGEVARKEYSTASVNNSWQFTEIKNNKIYRACVEAVDINGNSTKLPSFSSDVFTEDRAKPSNPESVILEDSSKWRSSSEPIVKWIGIIDNSAPNWKYGMENTGIYSIQYSIDGSSNWKDIGSNKPTDSKAIDCSTLADGNHTIAIRGIDTSGNYGGSLSVVYSKKSGSGTGITSGDISSTTVTIPGTIFNLSSINSTDIEKPDTIRVGPSIILDYYMEYTGGTMYSAQETNYTTSLSNDELYVIPIPVDPPPTGTTQQIHYYTPGSFETHTLTVSKDISTVKFRADYDEPLGTCLNFMVSSDGGITWQNAVPGANITFIKPGRNIRIRVEMSTDLQDQSPSVSALYLESDELITTQTIETPIPGNLVAKMSTNNTAILSWNGPIADNLTYNIYRSNVSGFLPSTSNKIASNVTVNSWKDSNISFGKTYYYKVTSLTNQNGTIAESTPSNETSVKSLDSQEISKRLGLQNQWGFSSFRTGSGTGYINLSSGNLVYQSTDFVFPGPRLALVMRRSFNSQSQLRTPLGIGWDFSFNTTLIKEVDSSGNQTALILKDGDGSYHRFTKDSTGAYTSPKGLYLKLTYDSYSKKYTIRRKDNITYTFDENMRLSQFTEPNNNSISIIYNSSGNIDSVMNSVGDTAKFYYDNEGKITKVTDPAGREFNYLYDENSDRLLKVYTIIENNIEYSEEYIYDSSYSRIMTIKDPKGNLTKLEYIGDKVTGFRDPSEEYYSVNYLDASTTTITNRGKEVKFTLDSNGSILIKASPLVSDIVYEYYDDYNLKSMSYYNDVVNSSGVTVNTLIKYQYSYDSNGNILTITDPEGNVTNYSNYNSFNEPGEIETPITKATTALSKLTYYSTSGNLETSTDPEGNKTKQYYDSKGNLTTIEKYLPDGYLLNTTEYVYNSSNKYRLSEIREPLGKTTKILEYDNQGNAVKIQDPKGYTTQNIYDKLGRLVKTIYPDGKYEEFSYDLNSNLIRKKDRRGLITSMEYDVLDRLIAVVNPDGSSVGYSYGFDAAGNDVVTVRDGGGRETKTTYDAAGRAKTTEANARSTTYTYDSIGNVIGTIDKAGREVKAEYNIHNMQVSITSDPSGLNIRSTFEYDLQGNKLKEINVGPNGHSNVTDFSYDKIGRLKSVTNNATNLQGAVETAVTQYKYGLRTASNEVYNATIDALGRENRVYFDALGRTVKEVNEGKVIGDTTKIEKSYTYDLNDNLKQVTKNDGTMIGYDFDELNRLKKIYSVADPTNTLTEFLYDEDNNKVKAVNYQDKQPITTIYSFDTLNRITEVIQDGNAVAYGYDSSGNRTKVSYATDAGDNVQDVEYIYDNFNRIQNIKVEGKNIRDYIYNSTTGEIDYIKNYTDFTNSDANSATRFTRVKYDVNKAGLVSGINYFNNNETTPVESYSMTYNSRGFVETENLSTSYAGETASSIQKTHLYDEIGRLLRTTTKENSSADKVTSYSYDLVGNRKTMQDGADSFVYGFDDDFNQLMTVTKNGSTYSTYTYFPDGNQKTEVTDGLTKTFTYDWGDKLVGVKLTKSGYTDSNITNFYSASGQRTRQVVDGITTKYVYDGINLLYTTDDNNIRGNEYVLDTSGAVIAAKRQETKLEGKYDFFNYDIRGSVTSIIGSDGKRIVGYTYDEFGKEKVVGDTNYKNDIMFSGSLFDRSSGLYYMNSRFYNSSAGRFISQDSYKGDVFEPWTQHLYVYTGNNPVNFVDPTGHIPRLTATMNDDADQKLPPVSATVSETSGLVYDSGASNGSTETNNDAFIDNLGSTYRDGMPFNPTRGPEVVQTGGEAIMTFATAAISIPAALSIVPELALGLDYLIYKIGSGSITAPAVAEVTTVTEEVVSTLDDITIINKKYTGQTFELTGDLAKKYPNGVKFTNEGFPDFSQYSIKTVTVEGLQGDAYYDFVKANQAAGYKITPKGFTWHHVEDGTTMMLVPTDLHSAVRHTGGASLIRKGFRP